MENRKQETENGKLFNWPVLHFRVSVSCFSFSSCWFRLCRVRNIARVHPKVYPEFLGMKLGSGRPRRADEGNETRRRSRRDPLVAGNVVGRLVRTFHDERRHRGPREVSSTDGAGSFDGACTRDSSISPRMRRRKPVMTSWRTGEPSGQLTPAEQEELESLVRVNTLLGILKAEARAVLATAA